MDTKTNSREYWHIADKCISDDDAFALLTGCNRECVDIARAFGRGENVSLDDLPHSCWHCFTFPRGRYTIRRPTIIVNGQEVPKPLSVEEAEAAGIVYYPSVISSCGVGYVYVYLNTTYIASRGMVHATHENARIHAKALFGEENVP